MSTHGMSGNTGALTPQSQTGHPGATPGDAPHTYQLVIQVTRPLNLVVGRLGDVDIPVGTYVYTGSAKRHLEARIGRHLRKEKTLRWHIDYLLAAPGVAVTEVRRSSEDECALNQATPGVVPVHGFGASDCRRGCVSHLKFQAGDAVSS
jgi:Uri superfamily endonuclease